MPGPTQADIGVDLVRRGGMTVTPPLRSFLSAQVSSNAEPPTSVEAILTSAMTGFFRAAADGYAFTNPGRIASSFGKTLEQNYPEAGATFLKFAYSYWTLKLVVGDADAATRSTHGHQLLAQVEQMVAGLFFPTPGPIRIDPDQRESTQRQTLVGSGAPIDIEDFIQRNPILLRDRRVSKTGCASAVATLAIFGTLAGFRLLA